MSGPSKKTQGKPKVKLSSWLKEGTHGAKFATTRLPVVDQGENLNFYQSNRNEPVPPDPVIISAVKFTSAVPPPRSASVPGNIEAGRPTSKSESETAGPIEIKRTDTGIPMLPFSSALFGSLKVSDGAGAGSPVTTKFCENTHLDAAKEPLIDGNAKPAKKLPSATNRKSGIELASKKGKAVKAGSNCFEGKARTGSGKEEKAASVSLAEALPTQGEVKGSADVAIGHHRADSGKSYVELMQLTNEMEGNGEANKQCYEDIDEGGRGPKLFIDSEDPLMDVKIVEVCSSNEVVIRSVDPKLHDELEQLEKNMFEEFEEWKKNPRMGVPSGGLCELKEYGFYTLTLSESQWNKCVRVQVLRLFKDRIIKHKARVFLIDYGLEDVVWRSHLFPLKSEWKRLVQLSCYAQVEGFINGPLDKETSGFGEIGQKYNRKTVCVQPSLPEISMLKTYESDAMPIPCKVRAVARHILDEIATVEYFLGKNKQKG